MRPFLIAAVVVVGVGIGCGQAWAQDAQPIDLSNMPCKAVTASDGTQFFSEVLSAAEGRFDKAGEGDKFGSDCNMADYVLKMCKSHPQYTLAQAIDNLVRLRRAGLPLPQIPMCGA